MKRPTIIVRVDGGICSQMHQYLLGHIFFRKNIDVEYDLRFFKCNGMDDEHKQVRNFDLLKAFPYLKFKTPSFIKTIVYTFFYKNIGMYPSDLSIEWEHICPPKILLGYYADPEYMYSTLFNEVFKIYPEKILDSENLKLYYKINRIKDSIAIHVRRGDLSKFHPAYGNPVTIKYFSDSVSFMNEKLEFPYYFIFSDDPEYVANELIPNIPINQNYYIILNGAHNGYMDLVLISNCKHQITSKGSLGKFGALLNKNNDKIIIVSTDDKQTFMLNHLRNNIVRL